MEIRIDQNTPEWLLMRRGDKGVRIGSSEAGAACGTSVFMLPCDLYAKVVLAHDQPGTTDEEVDPPPCAHGHRCEPLIARLYSQLTGNAVEEANYWQPRDPALALLYGASPDRKVFVKGKFEGLLEIKAPYGSMYTDVKPEHMTQIQYQMWITGMPWCDYMAVKLDHEKPSEDRSPPILLRRVHYNRRYVEEWMKPRLFYFSQCLMERHAPPSGLYRFPELEPKRPPHVPDIDLMEALYAL